MLGFTVNFPEAGEVSGEDLVNRLNCRACHSLAGQGGNRGPAWDGVGRRLTPEAIRKQLLTPRGRMPSFAHLRPEELEAVVKYLSDLK
jgi:mono/diheme cytochrome c family protein